MIRWIINQIKYRNARAWWYSTQPLAEDYRTMSDWDLALLEWLKREPKKEKYDL